MNMEKTLSQMSSEEKLQALLDFQPCRHERQYVLRYILALRHDDAEQTAWFESFGQSVHRHHVECFHLRAWKAVRLYGQAV